MRMKRRPLNLLVDEDLVKKAREHGLVISRFLENKLREYFALIEGKEETASSQTSDNLDRRNGVVRRGGDLNSRSPNGEPALKAGAVGRTLLPRHFLMFQNI